jgi:hypothetical protein
VACRIALGRPSPPSCPSLAKRERIPQTGAENSRTEEPHGGEIRPEHTLPDVITPSHVDVLQLLAAQAAISLENARLYAELQQVAEKSRHNEQRLRVMINTMPSSSASERRAAIASGSAARS